MYIICKECKKKLSGNSSYSLDKVDREYEKLATNIIWGCIDSTFEITLDNEKIKIPHKSHIIDDERLSKYIIKDGA